MEYNSTRTHLTIAEYGRNVQKMIDHATSLPTKEERTSAVNEIIKVMGQLNPHLRDVSDFTHKLWAHLFIMSDFKLDVDSPYPKPKPESLRKKPEKLLYPRDDIKFKHYGKTIEQIIKKAVEMKDGDEKEALIEVVANLMKRSYLTWNRDSVNDTVIFDHLRILSKEELKARPGFRLNETNEILASNKKRKRTDLPPGQNGEKRFQHKGGRDNSDRGRGGGGRRRDGR